MKLSKSLALVSLFTLLFTGYTADSEELPKLCDLEFKASHFCAVVDWTDGPITFVENKIDLMFFDTESKRRATPPYKLKVRAWNYYEAYWAPEPDVLLPKEGDPLGISWIRSLFFDRPGLWYVYFEFWDETMIDQAFIKLHLEDFSGVH